MATFKLSDGFGFEQDVTPGKGAFSKYVQKSPDMSLSNINLQHLRGEDLTKPAVTDLKGGLTFSDPIKLSRTDSVQLTVGATASANLAIFVPPAGGGPLFNPDTFGDEITVATGDRFISLTLIAQVSAGVSAAVDDLKFALNGKSTGTFGYYQGFAATANALESLTATLKNFAIPADLDDVAAMAEGSIATVEGTVDVSVSGTASLGTLTNALATEAIPQPAGNFAITGGAAISIGVTFEFTGDCQLRVQRLGGNLCRIGLYRNKTSKLDISASATAALTIKLGDNELFVKFMQSIFGKDAPDEIKKLEAAGLPADQSKALQTALKNAVDRTLSIGAKAELSSTSQNGAMFLYEVDLGAIQAAGRNAIYQALAGDFSTLVQATPGQFAGVRALKSVLSSSYQMQYSLKINLLGILNFSDVTTYLLKSQSAFDLTTGQVVLTDEVSADRVETLTSNLQVKDSAKLRKLLAEHFLITATYRAVAGIMNQPGLTGMQFYFDAESNPARVRMRDYVYLSVALGLQSEADALGSLPAIDDFGPTTIYAEAEYDAAACRSLFLDGANPVDPEAYARAGRNAIKCLVERGDDDDYRLILAADDALFARLQGIGDVQSVDFKDACVDAGIPEWGVTAVGVDYIDIVWLQNALHQAGLRLQKIDAFLQQNPHTKPDNPAFVSLKTDLAKHLKSVVQNASADFDGPWGFFAMAELGKVSSSRWLLLNQHLTGALPRPA